MAKQTGILKLRGPIGGLSFYHHRHYGWIARQSNPVGPERIRKDPPFARVRENGSEFGRASSAGRLLRHGLREFLQEIGTDFLDNRTMKLMMGIKNEVGAAKVLSSGKVESLIEVEGFEESAGLVSRSANVPEVFLPHEEQEKIKEAGSCEGGFDDEGGS